MFTSNTGATWDHIYTLAGVPKMSPRKYNCGPVRAPINPPVLLAASSCVNDCDEPFMCVVQQFQQFAAVFGFRGNQRGQSLK